MRARATDDWLACIPDAHPGYISRERHQESPKILGANGHGYDAARASIWRDGPLEDLADAISRRDDTGEKARLMAEMQDPMIA